MHPPGMPYACQIALPILQKYQIMMTIESRMVTKREARYMMISSRRMSFWCLLLDLHITTRLST